jgi:hypothetical protein
MTKIEGMMIRDKELFRKIGEMRSNPMKRGKKEYLITVA